MSSITIKIPDFLENQIQRLAVEGGLSVDQFFASAASEKLAVLEADSYIRQRAAMADGAAFNDAISQIPDTPVSEEWDQISQNSIRRNEDSRPINQ
jgi:hypothetical protein